jgi:enoyl-CoA hydratase/carnithine racemase
MSPAPSHSDELKVSFPAEHVLLLTMNRPGSLNAMSPTLAHDLTNALNWFEDEVNQWLVE